MFLAATDQILGLAIPVVIFFVAMYFFVMRPEKKRQQQQYQLIQSMKKDDKIVTIGGIHGIVEDIKEDVITIVVASGARIKLDKVAVKRIIKEEIK